MFQLAVDALSYGEEWTTTNSDWLSSFLQEGVQYVEFTNVLALYGQAITIVIDGALSGLQMVFLSVPPGAPLSLVQPTNQAIFEGSTATFNFATGGASPLAYQWLFNGIAIAGATNTSYSLTNAQITNAGQYSVMVTNLYGTLVSQAATLTVYDNASAGTLINVAFTGRPPTAKKGIAAIGATPIDFWNTSTPFWTNVYFADGAPSGTFLFATFTGGLFAGVYNNGATDPMYGTYVWTLDGSVTGSILIEITNLAPGGYDFYLYGHGNQDDQNGVFTLSVGSLSYGTEQTTTNAGWISPVWQEGVQYVEFTNVVVSAQQMVIITVALGASQYAVLSGLQMAALSVSSSSPFFVAPATSQTQSVTLGSTATFSVVASGAEPLTYQWMLNNSFIFGATNSNLTITNAQLTNSGNYFVIVNNAYGSLASPETALNVIVPVARVIDVAFTGDPVTGKTGFAATGVGPNDFWNTYVLGSGSLARLKFMDGTISDAGLAVANVAGFAGNGASDPMYGTYCVSEYEGNMTVTITNLDAGLYDLYFYGHGNYNSENSIFQLTVRSVDLGSKATINGPEYDSSVWQEGVQYVEFTNVTIAGQTVTVTVEPGGSAWGTLCGLQIVPLVLPSNKPPIVHFGIKRARGSRRHLGRCFHMDAHLRTGRHHELDYYLGDRQQQSAVEQLDNIHRGRW